TDAEADAVREAGEKTIALSERETALASAKANEIEAKAAQKDAQENLKDALAAVDQMLSRVAEHKLAYVPQTEPIRRDLMLDALRFYQKFLDKKSDDPVIRREVALAHRRLGAIHSRFGEQEKAEKSYHNAVEMLERLDPSSLADPALGRDRVNCHIEISWVLGALGKGDEAVKNLRRAVDLAEKLDREALENRSCLLNARNQLARHLTIRQPEEAEKILKANLALATDDQSLAGAHRGLAEVFKATKRIAQAEDAYRQALKHAEKMARESPSADWVQAALTVDLRGLASVVAADGRLEEAGELQRRAILILDKLATDFPYSLYRDALAEIRIEHAGLLMRLGRTEEAEAVRLRVLAHWETQAAKSSSIAGYRTQIARAHIELGNLHRDNGRPHEGEKAYRTALGIYEDLMADAPGDQGELLAKVGHCRRRLSFCLWDGGQTEEAAQVFGKAVRDFEKLSADYPGVASYRHFLADTLRNVGRLLAIRKEFPEAEKTYRQSLEIQQDRMARFADQPVNQTEAAAIYFDLGTLLAATGRGREAEPVLRKFLELTPKCGVGYTGDVDHFDGFFVPMAYWQLGNQDEARMWYEQSVKWMEMNHPKNGELRRYRSEASVLLGIKTNQ
ncbi:MAG: tetratricopeptide repeat protein, partial [Planctomycetaceae bacterium]|nr:tetratricopeptide repeat protein [Planctomycetaceae bacterium]